MPAVTVVPPEELDELDELDDEPEELELDEPEPPLELDELDDFEPDELEPDELELEELEPDELELDALEPLLELEELGIDDPVLVELEPLLPSLLLLSLSEHAASATAHRSTVHRMAVFMQCPEIIVCRAAFVDGCAGPRNCLNLTTMSRDYCYIGFAATPQRFYWRTAFNPHKVVRKPN